jgi:hypothetical protein
MKNKASLTKIKGSLSKTDAEEKKETKKKKKKDSSLQGSIPKASLNLPAGVFSARIPRPVEVYRRQLYAPRHADLTRRRYS